MKKELIIFLLLTTGILIFSRLTVKKSQSQLADHEHHHGCCHGH